MNWNWSDAWLLASIEMAAGKNGATLKGIIGAGDAINRAIFTLDELRHGAEKLIGTGYVLIEDGKFLVTRKYKTDSKKLHAKSKNLIKVVDLMFQLLQTRPIVAENGHDVESVINSITIGEAYRAYQANS